MACGGATVLLAALLCAAAAVSSGDDAVALLDFRATLAGGGALSGWASGSTPCDGDRAVWVGVICDDGTIYGLQLENMNLSGDLNLKPLAALPGLRTVSFMGNRFEGPMPDVGELASLKSVYLSRNQFSGVIPDGTFEGMRKLKKVYLSDNRFSGPIPTSLAVLPKLLELMLDGNGFEGGIPDLRQPGLEVVNVSYNNLGGPIPDGLSKMDAELFAGNKNLCGAPLRVACAPSTNLPPLPSKNLPPPDSPKKSSTSTSILIILLSIVALAATVGMIVAILRGRKEHDQLGRPPSKPKNVDSLETDILGKGPADLTVPVKKVAKEGDHGRLVFVKESRERFELQDLLKASAEILGSGNFGASYKAVLLQGNSVVVKRFKEMNGVGREEFQEHMRRIGRLSHPNLLPLVAYYYRKEEKLLVTDYILNGSLAHMLHGNHSSSLDWPTRLKIVKGVARGLAYLYDELPMLGLPHGHLKSSNVLLNDSYEPLLADYALIPVMNQSHASQIMVAYKSPEVTQYGQTSKKSDIWSFGILILEVLTGKFPATYLQRGKGSSDFADWVNSVVREEWTGDIFDSEMKVAKNGEGEMIKLLQIGLGCCEGDVEKRWEMNQVVEKIEALKEGDEEEGSPFDSETSRDGPSHSTDKLEFPV